MQSMRGNTHFSHVAFVLSRRHQNYIETRLYGLEKLQLLLVLAYSKFDGARLKPASALVYYYPLLLQKVYKK